MARILLESLMIHCEHRELLDDSGQRSYKACVFIGILVRLWQRSARCTHTWDAFGRVKVLV